MICCECFPYPVDLTTFCNNSNLTKENIVSIIFQPKADVFAWYLFYETERQLTFSKN